MSEKKRRKVQEVQEVQEEEFLPFHLRTEVLSWILIQSSHLMDFEVILGDMKKLPMQVYFGVFEDDKPRRVFNTFKSISADEKYLFQQVDHKKYNRDFCLLPYNVNHLEIFGIHRTKGCIDPLVKKVIFGDYKRVKNLRSILIESGFTAQYAVDYKRSKLLSSRFFEMELNNPNLEMIHFDCPRLSVTIPTPDHLKNVREFYHVHSELEWRSVQSLYKIKNLKKLAIKVDSNEFPKGVVFASESLRHLYLIIHDDFSEVVVEPSRVIDELIWNTQLETLWVRKRYDNDSISLRVGCKTLKYFVVKGYSPILLPKNIYSLFPELKILILKGGQMKKRRHSRYEDDKFEELMFELFKTWKKNSTMMVYMDNFFISARKLMRYKFIKDDYKDFGAWRYSYEADYLWGKGFFRRKEDSKSKIVLNMKNVTNVPPVWTKGVREIMKRSIPFFHFKYWIEKFYNLIRERFGDEFIVYNSYVRSVNPELLHEYIME